MWKVYIMYDKIRHIRKEQKKMKKLAKTILMILLIILTIVAIIISYFYIKDIKSTPTEEIKEQYKFTI